MSFNRPREMFTATCGDCGNECQIPFKPKDDRPVYCKECFQNHKPQERSGGSRFSRGSSYGRVSSYGRNDRGSRFSRGSRDDRPSEMFTVTCGDCGNECQIPFKPKDDRPVYCKECFQNHKPQERSGGSRFSRGSSYGRVSSYGRNDRGSRFSRGSRGDIPREMFTVTCGDCGNECQIPFKPKDDRPVYCKECFQNHKQN
ncbi:MAG: hypothetical protein IH841_01015 [Thaumarchaeota archaeon]|nr:hypothetical protein [Nitrososphaerota archaeon]